MSVTNYSKKNSKWYYSKASEIYSAVISLMGTNEQAIIDVFFELSSESEYQKLKKAFDFFIIENPHIKYEYKNLDDLLKQEFGIIELLRLELILNRFTEKYKAHNSSKSLT